MKAPTPTSWLIVAMSSWPATLVSVKACDTDTYYGSLLTSSTPPTRAQLQNHLETTQSFQITTENQEWQVLRDLYSSSDDGTTIFLPFRDRSASAALAGQLWTTEYLFSTTDPIIKDVFHLIPADTTVKAARGNLFFGDCSVVDTDTSTSACQTPASARTPSDTSLRPGGSFLPPAASRGDIARALFYMSVRYSLPLTDCPAISSSASMGYLSQLLEWHAEDPPSDEEQERNDGACRRWQGNRNPFIDNPDWVQPIFGDAQTQVPYVCATVPTNPVTQSPVSSPTGGVVTEPPSPTVPTTGGSSPEPPSSQVDPSTGLFVKCGRTNYYSGISDISSREALTEKLQSSHRRSLPYTDTDGDDVWKALEALDGDGNGRVNLIYASTTTDVRGASGWNREHLWPRSRGIDDSGDDYTDLHHLRPSDWNVNTARSNKYFGSCETAQPTDDTCRQPATDQAADDTEASRTTWLPPVDVRGDIARALFYMDVRYSGNAEDELDLTLTDCPISTDDTQMAYLSQLLQWHIDDPVTEEERLRNDAVCERWQGNRNPFVDFPDLVSTIFGNPRSTPYDCPSEFDPPDQPNRPTQCVGPGDIMTVGLNADNPDTLAFLALDDIPGGMILYATDNAWTGEDFRNNEGVIRLQIPSRGIPAGTVFGYGDNRDPDKANEFSQYSWERVRGDFALSMAGDTVLLFCYEEGGEGLTFISGFNYGGGWTNRGGDTTYSALPDQLADTFVETAVTLIHADNYRYSGPTTGTITFLRSEIVNRDNWSPSNDNRFTDLSSWNFQITVGSSPTDPPSGGVKVEGGTPSAVAAVSDLWLHCCIHLSALAGLVVAFV